MIQENNKNAKMADNNDEPTLEGLAPRIDAFIAENPHGVSIQDVALKFGISRYTTNGILGYLMGAGKIGVKQIGPVKVHYSKKEVK